MKVTLTDEVKSVINRIVAMLAESQGKLPDHARAALAVFRKLVSDEAESGEGEAKEALVASDIVVAQAQLDILRESLDGEEWEEDMVSMVDALPGLLDGMLAAAREMDREAKRDAQKARAAKYGIAILAQTNITKPGEWSQLSDDQFGDPVNYRYPIHDLPRIRNARSRFAQEDMTYKGKEVVRQRIENAAKKAKVGEYREGGPRVGGSRVDDTGGSITTGDLVESAYLTEAVSGTEGLVWDIVCIEAGMSANRKRYSPEVLMASVPLFDGVQSFADHPPRDADGKLVERSVNDLCGWVSNPRWESTGGKLGQGAVMGTYNAMRSHPIAAKLKEAWERGKPDLIQFSILGSGSQRIMREEGIGLFHNVESIEALHSLDTVTKGAAGGRVNALIASINQEVSELKKLEEMTAQELMEVLELRPELKDEIAKLMSPPAQEPGPVVESDPPGPSETVVDAKLAQLEEQVASLVGVTKQLADTTAKSQSQALLATTLAEVKDLPGPVVTALREDFTDRIFGADELTSAVERQRDIWGRVVQHDRPRVSTIQMGEAEVDKLIHGVGGLIEGTDLEGVPRFKSIHQAYCTVTGKPMDSDREYVAKSVIREGIGYDPLFQADMLRESISWTLVLGATLHRRLIKEYQIPAFDDWRKIVSDVTTLTDFKTHRSDRQGFYSVLPTVNKGGTYQALTSPSEMEASYAAVKKGGLEDWCWEDAMNDDLGALKRIPKKLALAAKIGLFQFVMNFLRDGNSTATTYDGINLFHASHGSNLGTDALGNAGLDAAKIIVRSQAALPSTDVTLAIMPKYLLVPNELESKAKKLRDSDYIVPDTEFSTSAGFSANIANPHKGTFELIVVDYWTDANRWYLVADPNLCPTIEVGFLNGRQEPELLTLANNTGSAFTADKIVMKARFVYGGAVLDHRGMYASEPS